MNAVIELQSSKSGRIPAFAPRTEPAYRIKSDAEALTIARELADVFASGAAERDRNRRLPAAEIEQFSQSGLWAVSVPREQGGADVVATTVAEIIATISAADSNIGQIPQNHYYMVEALRLDANEAQKQFYFERVLAGDRFGNALSELGGTYPTDYKTTVLADGDGFILNGRKYYSTGVLFAHWVAAVANNADGKRMIVFVPRDTQGLTLLDDWNSFGQKTTASGTTGFDAIKVSAFALVEHYRAFERPTGMGPFAQLLHAAVDLGIARAAYQETLSFVRQRARAFVDSGVTHAYEDPYTIAAVGDLQVRQTAAEALVERAGEFVEKARVEPGQQTSEEASIAVAEARAITTEVSLNATTKFFELAGTRSTDADLALDRHWRNARTHTLHDPVRWKFHAIGNYWLNDIAPPRRGTI
jgi:SfnB family sulfur acquisition oxidoreductase